MFPAFPPGTLSVFPFASSKKITLPKDRSGRLEGFREDAIEGSYLLLSSLHDSKYVQPLLTSQHLNRNPTYPSSSQANLTGGGAGEVNHTTVAVGATIVNTNHDLLSRIQIGNPYSGTKGQGAMGGCQGILIKYLATGAATTVETGAIPGRHAGQVGKHRWRSRGGGSSRLR